MRAGSAFESVEKHVYAALRVCGGYRGAAAVSVEGNFVCRGTPRLINMINVNPGAPERNVDE